MVTVRYLQQVLPPTARTACPRPVALPDRDLTEKEVTSAWGKDRTALIACESRRAAAVATIEDTSGDQ
ncbi:hypothetical protein ACXHXM_02060